MKNDEKRDLIHRLILAREMGRQGYRWNRAFRRELWRRITPVKRADGVPVSSSRPKPSTDF